MPRVKRGFKARRRRKEVLKAAKGSRGGRSKQFRTASVTVDRAGCMPTGIGEIGKGSFAVSGLFGSMLLPGKMACHTAGSSAAFKTQVSAWTERYLQI